MVFGYLYSAAGGTVDFNEAMYGSVLTQSLAALVISVGLFPRRPPAFSLRSALLPLAAFALLSAAIIVDTRLPTLVMVDDLEAFAAASSRTLTRLTGWHWGLSLIPADLRCGSGGRGSAALPRPGSGRVGRWSRWCSWLVRNCTPCSGRRGIAQSSTTSSLLRVAFTAVVAVGSFLELRPVAAERAMSLAAEREYVERLQDLAQLRADFTAIVAHELGNPIGTVVQAAELLATGPLDPIDAGPGCDQCLDCGTNSPRCGRACRCRRRARRLCCPATFRTSSDPAW